MKDLDESLKAWLGDPEMYASESRAAVLVGRLRSRLKDLPEVGIALKVLSVAKMWRDAYTHTNDTAALVELVNAECKSNGMSILEAKAVLAAYFAKGLQTTENDDVTAFADENEKGTPLE